MATGLLCYEAEMFRYSSMTEEATWMSSKTFQLIRSPVAMIRHPDNGIEGFLLNSTVGLSQAISASRIKLV